MSGLAGGAPLFSLFGSCPLPRPLFVPCVSRFAGVVALLFSLFLVRRRPCLREFLVKISSCSLFFRAIPVTPRLCWRAVRPPGPAAPRLSCCGYPLRGRLLLALWRCFLTCDGNWHVELLTLGSSFGVSSFLDGSLSWPGRTGSHARHRQHSPDLPNIHLLRRFSN